MSIWKKLFGLFDSNQQETEQQTEPIETPSPQDNIAVTIDDEMPSFLKTEETDIPSQKEDEKLPSEETSDAIETSDERKYDETEEQDEIEVTHSLLEDMNLVKLFGECTSLMDKLEQLSQGFQSDKEQFLINLVEDELYNSLLLAGGTPINNDEAFDIIRHKCVNNIDAKDGMPIEEIVKPGLMLEDRVYIRAMVRVQSEQI